ncbi:MAG: hypothetical protein ACP6IQ_08640 [Candidatus Njordarchaeia archaeon]
MESKNIQTLLMLMKLLIYIASTWILIREDIVEFLEKNNDIISDADWENLTLLCETLDTIAFNFGWVPQAIYY